MVFNANFNKNFSYIVAVSFIGGVNRTEYPGENHRPAPSH